MLFSLVYTETKLCILLEIEKKVIYKANIDNANVIVICKTKIQYIEKMTLNKHGINISFFLRIRPKH